ncbi:uncharacterized protein E0L32_007787 [Thyridium curvatum]|uniref:DUF6594 domain-containing protein n=1 Tax=Thyridium curvatum TaxID=1093900 RepID=A0A507AXU9_9PEZI|nr:uncharacterized protein E0L32_007787 [Thyridium curvatum]TPX11576.1 hypothetical protein E0L32_007787 [Thyridium curvatum]
MSLNKQSVVETLDVLPDQHLAIGAGERKVAHAREHDRQSATSVHTTTEGRSRPVIRETAAAPTCAVRSKDRIRPRSATARSANIPAETRAIRSKSVPRRHHQQAPINSGDNSDIASSEEEMGDSASTKRSKVSAQPALQERDSSLVEMNPTGLLTAQDGSGSSSGSGSTITQVSYTRHSQVRPKASTHAEEPMRSHEKRARKPDALSFLDPDSPVITEESIQRSVAESARWRHRPDLTEAKTSPSARSNSSSSTASMSSTESNPFGDRTADHDTDPSTSPEQSVKGDGSPVPKSSATGHQKQPDSSRHDKYGTPEMPRGSANLPHLPAKALNPRPPNQNHVKHLPRAEKLPLSGYELLAARLSSQSPMSDRSRRGSIGASSVRSGSSRGGFDDGLQLRPVYRRFEALNHRLLLHLQDELSELEEQLHRLDTADTQTRRLQNRILPASRRAEYLAGGELQWHKTDILGKIGYKLGQYRFSADHALSSFTETQKLPAPTFSDVETYRTYLATQQPIAEIETRFLEPVDDLVSLAPSSTYSPSTSSQSSASDYLNNLSDDALTPMPRSGPFLPSLPPRSSRASSMVSRSRPATALRERDEMRQAGHIARSSSSPVELPHLAISMAVAVLVPIMTFSVIPGFVGRMTVVLLVALGVFGAQMQAGTIPVEDNPAGNVSHKGSTNDLALAIGFYGAVMAIMAAISS